VDTHFSCFPSFSLIYLIIFRPTGDPWLDPNLISLFSSTLDGVSAFLRPGIFRSFRRAIGSKQVHFIVSLWRFDIEKETEVAGYLWTLRRNQKRHVGLILDPPKSLAEGALAGYLEPKQTNAPSRSKFAVCISGTFLYNEPHASPRRAACASNLRTLMAPFVPSSL
jgi:hypothetical protein